MTIIPKHTTFIERFSILPLIQVSINQAKKKLHNAEYRNVVMCEWVEAIQLLQKKEGL
jgi:hypothetical protein